jgi:hypothetical protein
MGVIWTKYKQYTSKYRHFLRTCCTLYQKPEIICVCIVLYVHVCVCMLGEGLYLCVSVCICLYLHVYACIWAKGGMWIPSSESSLRRYICACMCMYVHVSYKWIYICIYVYVLMCMCMYVYVCACIPFLCYKNTTFVHICMMLLWLSWKYAHIWLCRSVFNPQVCQGHSNSAWICLETPFAQFTPWNLQEGRIFGGNLNHHQDMHTCSYMQIHAYMCIYRHIHTNTYQCMQYMYIYTHTYIYTHIHAHIYQYMQVHAPTQFTCFIVESIN